MTSLAVGVLARDEGRTLARTLRSVAKVADEVVVAIDPRSQDDTASVAASEGARVLELDRWPGMAAARNRLADACQSRWFLGLDGHEWLDDGAAVLRSVLDSPESIPGPVACVLLATSEREGGVVCPAPRLYDRERASISGEVHPRPSSPDPGETALIRGVLVRHDDPKSGAPEYRQRQQARFIKLLEEHLSARASDAAERAPFVIEAAASLGVDHLAASYGLGWVQGPGRRSQPERRCYVGCIAGEAALRIGEIELASALRDTLLSASPAYARTWLLRGDIALEGGQVRRAEESYLLATRCPPPALGWFRPRDSTWLPWLRLALPQLQRGDERGARESLKRATEGCGATQVRDALRQVQTRATLGSDEIRELVAISRLV